METKTQRGQLWLLLRLLLLGVAAGLQGLLVPRSSLSENIQITVSERRRRRRRRREETTNNNIMVAQKLWHVEPLRCSVDAIWKACKNVDEVLPRVMPDYFQKSEYLEGNGGPGTLRLITMGPAVGHAKQVKERMDVIDEENKTLKYTMVDGDPRYSSFGGMMKFTSGAEQGTSDAYWEVQYEPVGDMGPPEHVKAMVIKVFRALEGAINADPQSFA